MRYTNLLEKIVSLFDITSDSWVNLGFLSFFVIILLLLCIKKISKKTGFVLSLIGDIVLISYTVVTHYDVVSKLMDNIVDHLFMDIYFPSIYVYLFVFLFINIVTIGSLLNVRKKGLYHTINGVVFLITNFVLALVLDIISKNKIDVFSKSSLFSNTDLILLLEFSVSIFMIWLLSLGVIYFTNIISERILLRGEKKSVKKKIKLVETTNLEVELADVDNGEMEENKSTVFVPENSRVFQVIEEEVRENKFIPTFGNVTSTNIDQQLMVEEEFLKQTQNQEEMVPTYVPIQNQQTIVSEVPKQMEQDYVSTTSVIENEISSINGSISEKNQFDLSSFIPRKQENRVISSVDTGKIFEQILNNQLPLMNIKEEVVNPYEAERNTYTLNDYRIFNKMLKDIKEHNQSNAIHIDKMLEYRLITKYSSETYDLFKRMLKNYSN